MFMYMYMCRSEGRDSLFFVIVVVETCGDKPCPTTPLHFGLGWVEPCPPKIYVNHGGYPPWSLAV